jgi:uncharacterized C2H2 Zn-finger protein
MCKHKTVHEPTAADEGEKDEFACGKCGERFKQSSSLHAHEFWHASVASHHVCRTCTKAFDSEESLVAHRTREHALEMVNRCQECGKIYQRTEDLRRHTTVVHGNSIREYCNKSEAEDSKEAVKSTAAATSTESPAWANRPVKTYDRKRKIIKQEPAF